jgi:hypothetical protein
MLQTHCYYIFIGLTNQNSELTLNSKYTNTAELQTENISQVISTNINLLIIYLQSQLRVLFDVIISLVSQQISAPLGHPQVNHKILFILS